MIGTNWEGIARELRFPNVATMFRKYYVETEMSIEQLAGRFGVSSGQIRTQLVAAGITLRPRGGAQQSKITMTDDLLSACESKGTKQVAAELGVSYSALHKALRRYVTSRKVEEASQSQETPQSADPGTDESLRRSSPSPAHPERDSSSASRPQGSEELEK